mmetsp:Transcript_12999/g.23678  ORF Transcript_12999/g.23678 Transcript_12999/m.23678 type:complete len:253 (+) Transcript_12999:532-1290(+)
MHASSEPPFSRKSSLTVRFRIPRHRYMVLKFFLCMCTARSFLSALEMSSVVPASGWGFRFARRGPLIRRNVLEVYSRSDATSAMDSSACCACRIPWKSFSRRPSWPSSFVTSSVPSFPITRSAMAGSFRTYCTFHRSSAANSSAPSPGRSQTAPSFCHSAMLSAVMLIASSSMRCRYGCTERSLSSNLYFSLNFIKRSVSCLYPSADGSPSAATSPAANTACSAVQMKYFSELVVYSRSTFMRSSSTCSGVS